jgi:hypothetical protein
MQSEAPGEIGVMLANWRLPPGLKLLVDARASSSLNFGDGLSYLRSATLPTIYGEVHYFLKKPSPRGYRIALFESLAQFLCPQSRFT